MNRLCLLIFSLLLFNSTVTLAAVPSGWCDHGGWCTTTTPGHPGVCYDKDSAESKLHCGKNKFNRQNVKMVDGQCSVNGKVGPYEKSPCVLLYPASGATPTPTVTPLSQPTIKPSNTINNNPSA